MPQKDWLNVAEVMVVGRSRTVIQAGIFYSITPKQMIISTDHLNEQTGG